MLPTILHGCEVLMETEAAATSASSTAVSDSSGEAVFVVLRMKQVTELQDETDAKLGAVQTLIQSVVTRLGERWHTVEAVDCGLSDVQVGGIR